MAQATTARAANASADRGDYESLQQAQRRREVAVADRRELELSQKRGELLQASEVNALSVPVSRQSLRALFAADKLKKIDVLVRLLSV